MGGERAQTNVTYNKKSTWHRDDDLDSTKEPTLSKRAREPTTTPQDETSQPGAMPGLSIFQMLTNEASFLKLSCPGSGKYRCHRFLNHTLSLALVGLINDGSKGESISRRRGFGPNRGQRVNQISFRQRGFLLCTSFAYLIFRPDPPT